MAPFGSGRRVRLALDARQAPQGAVVDVGTYDAVAFSIALIYAKTTQPVFAYDYFDAPPAESTKKNHGPSLCGTVKERLRPWQAAVVAGDVREQLHTLPERIGCCQIDLNDAEAESAVLAAVYPRLVPGGVLLLDDYGFSRYSASAEAHRAYLADKEQVLEMMTGQGLLIKK